MKDPDGNYYEYCHAVIVLKRGKDPVWMDVNGISKGVPENLYFHSKVDKVVLLKANEDLIRSAFTMCDISEESIQKTMDFARGYPPVQNALEGGCKWM